MVPVRYLLTQGMQMAIKCIHQTNVLSLTFEKFRFGSETFILDWISIHLKYKAVLVQTGFGSTTLTVGLESTFLLNLVTKANILYYKTLQCVSTAYLYK
jgi:hypothetical protein